MVGKVVDISMVFDRMIIRVSIQGIIISVITVHVPQYDLYESQEENFYDSLVNVVRKIGEKEIIVIAGGLNGHVGNNAEEF